MKHLTINIFCMIRELDGLMNFSIYPVCLRPDFVYPSPEEERNQDYDKLTFRLETKITISSKGRFSGSEILHPPGRRSGITKAERRETGRRG